MLAIVVVLTGYRAARAQPSGPPVAAIEVVGNQRVADDAIRIHINQQVGQSLNPDTVDQDVKAIYKMGFFRRVSAEEEHRPNGVVVIYHVEEQPMVTDVQLKGMKAIKPTDDKIVSVVMIHPGAILDPSRVQETVQGIQQVYQDKGYLDAKVVPDELPRAGNDVAVVFNVNEGPLVRVTDIEFTGNHHFSSRRLRGEIETGTHNILSFFTGTGVLDNKKLASDMDRLTAFYYDNGFLNAVVSQPIIRRHDNSLAILIHVDEGPIYKFSNIGFEGNLKFPEKELQKQLTIKPGETFRGTSLQHNVLTLSDYYSNLGYAYVTVDPHTAVNPSTHTVAVAFAINPGREVLIDRINITGNTKTSDKVIRREMTVEEQEPYSAAKIRESKARLDRLGFFSQTHLTTQPATQPDRIDLNVNVTEANTASFQLGGGFDTSSSLFGNFTLGDSNLFGGGESLMLNAQVGFLFQNFSLNYTEPWFLDMPLAVTMQLFDNKSYLISFNQTAVGFAIQSFYPLAELGLSSIGPISLKNVNAGLGYQFESVGITGLQPFATFDILRDKGYRLLSIISPSIRRFTVDNPIDPRTGSVESMNIDLAGLGGNGRYIKSTFHVRYFFNFLKSPVWGSWVESPSVTFGIGSSLQGGSAGELPLYARFFPGGTGGQGDVRGYQLYSLGPEVITYNQLGQPINVSAVGGSKELILSNQVSFPLLSALGIRGFGFTDAGNSYFLHSAWPLTSLQASAGVGLFWRSPFGPISGDIAFPLNPRPNDKSIVFDVGAGSL
ncbi:MAG TPA: outer membrane protein assembly factor BamA [Candidatus Binataceae bacterium]|nr:outer membrane protein assembly factor BamA [Candidatus Binataceae bacterium]